MHAPLSACEAVYRLQKDLRLCWVGRPRKYQDELNPGSFGICQLYHINDSGDINDPNTFREFWHVTNSMELDGSLLRVRIDRGPLFARDGSTTPDYDTLRYNPIFVADFSQFDISTQDVFDGSFIVPLRRWMKPIYDRLQEDADARGDWVNRRAADIVERVTDKQWFEANKTSETGHRMAKKHARADMLRIGRKAEQGIDFKKTFALPKPWKRKR